MAGNKHKNGIVCMFPGCEKKMRTQKFKGHFVKAHLREGEEYTVEHRRQFEVAQTEPLADSDSASATASPMDTLIASGGSGTPKTKTEPAKRASLDMATKVADAISAGVTAHEFPTEPSRLAEPEDPAPTVPAAPLFVAPPAPAPAPAPVRAKRPAAAMAPDVAALALPANLDELTTVKLFMHLDRQYNELSAKIDEVVEMQRLLVSAFMAKDASAEEHAAKKRKEASSTIV